jgi:hypothetical protein
LTVSLGGVNVYTNTMTIADNPGPYKWKGPITTTPLVPSDNEQTLRFDYDCAPSSNNGVASSYIFLDELSLMSN